MAPRSFSWSDHLRSDRARTTSYRLHPVYCDSTGICERRPNHFGNASDCVGLRNHPYGTLGPAGCVFGARGASWIRFRSSSLHASRRLLLESALLGTVLGGVVPISALVWGWGPREKVLSVVPRGAGSGLVSAFLVVRALRKRGLLFEVRPASSIQGL